MASLKQAYAENVPGNFFVDDTCIDCDLCRQIAPAVFKEDGDHSVVYRQPRNEAETLRAAIALVSCPTASIGARDKSVVAPGVAALPDAVNENVYFCGYASADSFGAASYFIQRPEGNVLVDSPRFALPLVQKFEAMGGVSLMFLTHRDDVADHAQYHDHFGCERIIHRDDDLSTGAERLIEGADAVRVADDLTVIPTPGHTRGHAVLLYRNTYLFTGDHLAWSPRRDALIAFRNATWYSWREQTKSMERLLDYTFEWVLPGHGRPVQLAPDVMRQKLRDCVEWMKTR